MTGLDISDRHLRPAEGVASSGGARPLDLEVVVGGDWSRTVAGQLLLSCLVNLLCRLTDLVTSVNIVSADAEPLVRFPSNEQPKSLLAELVNLSEWAVGGRVPVTLNARSRPHIRLVIGGSGDNDGGVNTIVGYGHGWRSWIGREGGPFPSGASANPIGPFLAAALLAGEVFKAARATTRGRPIRALAYSLWSGEQDANLYAVEDGPELAGLALPPFYLAGAGAVGQGLMYVLGATDLASGYVVGIDDDVHDGTNLNRCFLAGPADVGKPKLDAVGRFLRQGRIELLPRTMTVLEHVTRPRPRLRADLAAAEAEGRYGVVVSCVDKNVSRSEIQGLRPDLIVGGSTKGLSAKTNVYEPSRGTACLACHNPPERDGARLRQAELAMRDMTDDERRAYLQGKVSDVEAVLRDLKDGRCGTVGQSEFRRIAIETEREFSVSFVSMAAAVLLAGRLFQHLLFDQVSPRRTPMTTFAFLAGRCEDVELAVNSACGCQR